MKAKGHEKEVWEKGSYARAINSIVISSIIQTVRLYVLSIMCVYNDVIIT